MADTPIVASNTKNDLIIAAVQKNLIEKSVLAPLVRDVSAFAIKGAKSIEVPRLSNFTVQDRTFGATGDAEALLDSADQINFDFNAYIAYLYDSRSVYQSSIDWQVEAALRSAASHAKYVDTKIIETAVAVAGAEIVASDVKTEILGMREYILQNGGDIGRMSLWISTAKEAEMLAVQDFVRADFYGSSNVRTGQIGQIYGVPVVISRQLGGTNPDMIMCDADGIGLGFQEGVQMSEQKANEYGANSMRVAMDQVFGLGGLELNEQGAGAGLSPLVAKLAV
jgi:hypothetical protein